MYNEVKSILDRLLMSDSISNKEYSMMLSYYTKTVVTRYTLDGSSTTTWEPLTKIKIPESKL